MQSLSTDIRFGPLSGIWELVPPERAVFVTGRALRVRAEALLLEPRDGGPHLAHNNLRWIKVPDGEACKSFATLESVCRALLAMGASSGTTLVSIGGGSVSDLAGLAAHLWNRGIRFVTSPTTLLSMIDASIGGKNAIDLDSAKNVVGSFHAPSDMLCDVRWLSSLSARDFRSGLAEAVKHAILDGEEHLRFFEEIAASNTDPQSLGAARLEELIGRSLAVKQRFVSADPLDAHQRHALNYGHSFGHAIELLTGLPHGYAVAAGIGEANRFAVRRGSLDAEIAVRVAALLSSFGLPVSISDALPASQRSIDRHAIAKKMRADKKRRDDAIDFAMPYGIGDIRVESVQIQEIEEFLGAEEGLRPRSTGEAK